MASLLLAGGCSTPEASRPLTLHETSEASDVPAASKSSGKPIPKVLSLHDALGMCLDRNPRLAALAQEAEARRGGEVQAGLLPNPTLAIDVENFGRSRMRLGQLNGPEYTLSLSQLVELGGKRTARLRAARVERRLAQWDYETARLDLLAQVAFDFIQVLANQEQQVLAQEAMDVSRKTLEAVRAKVEAGKVSPTELSRAQVQQARAQLELDRAQGEISTARTRLAAHWGGLGEDFQAVAGNLDSPQELPDLAFLTQALQEHPAIARWEDETEQRLAGLQLARAGRVVDPTVTGGSRFLDETDESAFLVGLSIPLPISNRNQGHLLEAETLVDQVAALRDAAFVERRAMLMAAHQAAQRASHRSQVLFSEILPAAELALGATRESYAQGKVGLTDVLDAERTWLETRQEHLDALRDYHRHRSALEALVGTTLTSTSSNPS